MMKVITFFSAKGGTGKTTFNMLFASYLSYQLGKRVMVVDLDVPEYNLTNCRERELAYLKEKELPCDPDNFYTIEAVEDTSETNIRALAAIIRGLRDKLDYLILDFKGSFKSGDPVLILAEENVLDKVIMPMELDPMVIASVKSLSRVFQDNGQDTLLFYNRVHGRENPELYDRLTEWFTKNGCKVSPHKVKGNIAMRREQADGAFFRSTVNFPAGAIRKQNPGILDLFDEIIGDETGSV